MSDDGWGLPGSRARRRAEIYGTAARVAARYGRLRLPGAPSGRRRGRAVADAHRRGARDVRRTAVHLRGGFLKLGQFVSARPDLLPEAYVEELSKLQDRVPPAPAAVVERIVAEDVGPVDRVFAAFDRGSASAASLAQVHRARRHDGSAVAVKVQYPGVAEIVPTEIRDTRRILEAVSKVVRGIGLDTVARALESSVLDELDYEKEAANVERFKANFEGEPGVVVPGVHRDLSHGRVLVLDWIEGENLARALRTVDREIADEAARVLVDAYLKQILVDGFLHADPHPGNFLLQVDGGAPRIGVVDFGACAVLSEPARAGLRDVYRAAISADLPAVVDGLHRLGFRTRSGDAESLLAWASLFSFDADSQDDRQASWRRLTRAARADPVVHIPPELVLLGRVLIVQTGLVASLRPSWSVDELAARRLAEADAAAR